MRYGPLPNIGDANNKPLSMSGIATLVVRLGDLIVKADFIFCNRLEAPVIRRSNKAAPEASRARGQLHRVNCPHAPNEGT